MLLGATIVLASCAGKHRLPDTPDHPPPSYSDIAAAYNARAERLSRLWARAVVSVEFTDDTGQRRREQGEGHFQVVQPSRLALSAGKLGEVILWLGCDERRYWFIDAKERKTAWFGRHDAASPEKIERLGLPASPRDLLALTGITPLTTADAYAEWGESRRSILLTSDLGAARWRWTLDPSTRESTRIDVFDRDTGSPIITATLAEYAPVALRASGAIPPRVPTRIRALHHPSGSKIGLSLADVCDGGPGKLRPENFDFDALARFLNIRAVADLDDLTDQPPIPQEE